MDLNSRFGEPGQPPALVGDAAVRSALRNLLTSYPGSRSRTFNQRWGSGILDILQEPISQVTAGSLRINTIAAIKTWEPRVSLIESSCRFAPNYNLPGYDVTLVYTIRDAATVYAYELTLKK